MEDTKEANALLLVAEVLAQVPTSWKLSCLLPRPLYSVAFLAADFFLVFSSLSFSSLRYARPYSSKHISHAVGTGIAPRELRFDRSLGAGSNL